GFSNRSSAFQKAPQAADVLFHFSLWLSVGRSRLALVSNVKSLLFENLDGLMRICRIVRRNSGGLQNERPGGQFTPFHNYRPFRRPTGAKPFRGCADLVSGERCTSGTGHG